MKVSCNIFHWRLVSVMFPRAGSSAMWKSPTRCRGADHPPSNRIPTSMHFGKYSSPVELSFIQAWGLRCFVVGNANTCSLDFCRVFNRTIDCKYCSIAYNAVIFILHINWFDCNLRVVVAVDYYFGNVGHSFRRQIPWNAFRMHPLKIPISPARFPRNISGWKVHLSRKRQERYFKEFRWFRSVLLSKVTNRRIVGILGEWPVMLVQYEYGSDALVISQAWTLVPIWRWNSWRPRPSA